MTLGRLYQLSDSCLHSTKDASQIRDGPFNFLGWVGFLKYLFYHIDVERMVERSAIYAPAMHE